MASADGRVEIGIRDLDQTVIGNPAHDLVRLGLSLATAARGSDLPGVTTAHMLEAMVDGYERAISHPTGSSPQEYNASQSIKVVLEQALKRKWHHLAEECIKDLKPTIPLGRCFWPLSSAEKGEIDRLFKTEEAAALVTSLHQRNDDDQITVADAAYWMKGCSSLGRLRYAVLLRVGKQKKGMAGFCLMDIKEAAKAAASHAANSPMPRNNAARMVMGARSLSPFLGERMLAGRVCDRAVVLRELLPQDLKLEIETLTCEEAVAVAGFLAGVVGEAHGRQMSAGARKGWSSELKSNRPKSIEVPSWLWTSVVELIGSTKRPTSIIVEDTRYKRLNSDPSKNSVMPQLEMALLSYRRIGRPTRRVGRPAAPLEHRPTTVRHRERPVSPAFRNGQGAGTEMTKVVRLVSNG